MDIDQLVLLLLICAGAYLAGYSGLAFGLLVLTGLIFLAGGIGGEKKSYPVSAGGVRVHGAEMLEPIVIETSKGAPFRIPNDMDIKICPTWLADNLIEKATGRGLGPLARTIHGGLFGRKWQ